MTFPHHSCNSALIITNKGSSICLLRVTRENGSGACKLNEVTPSVFSGTMKFITNNSWKNEEQHNLKPSQHVIQIKFN